MLTVCKILDSAVKMAMYSPKMKLATTTFGKGDVTWTLKINEIPIPLFHLNDAPSPKKWIGRFRHARGHVTCRDLLSEQVNLSPSTIS